MPNDLAPLYEADMPEKAAYRILGQVREAAELQGPSGSGLQAIGICLELMQDMAKNRTASP